MLQTAKKLMKNTLYFLLDSYPTGACCPSDNDRNNNRDNNKDPELEKVMYYWRVKYLRDGWYNLKSQEYPTKDMGELEFKINNDWAEKVRNMAYQGLEMLNNNNNKNGNNKDKDKEKDKIKDLKRNINYYLDYVRTTKQTERNIEIEDIFRGDEVLTTLIDYLRYDKNE